MITKEMEKMVNYIKNTGSEDVRKGLEEFFNLLETMNTENEKIEQKNLELKTKIEELIQKNTRLKDELNMTVGEKIKNRLVDLLRSEKSGL